MIKNNEDLKKYISISPNFEFADFEIYIPKAVRTYLKRYVGNLYEDLENINETDSFNAIKTKAQTLVDTAVANFAFFLYTPYLSVSMDGSGMYVVENDKRKAVTGFQLNDIRRELVRSGHEAMDELLELLEHNADAFEDWHNNYSTLYRDSLMYSTSEFDKHYNIFNSRQTFLSLKPSILNVEDKVINTSFSREFIKELKGTVSGVKADVKTLLQKAIIRGTIAKVYAEGIYNITPSGIILRFDLLEYERKTFAEINEQIKNAIESNTNDMNAYLQQAHTLAKDIDGALIEKKESNGYKPIITKSIVGI